MQVSDAGSSSTNAVSIQDMMAAMMKKQWFDKMDTNCDGVVDASELADLAKATDKSAEDIITKYDKDQDGVLNATEFDKMMQGMRPKFRPNGMQNPPLASSSDRVSDTEQDDKLESLLELLKNGKTDEAKTVLQNIHAANLSSTSLYGSNGASLLTASLLSIQA